MASKVYAVVLMSYRSVLIATFTIQQPQGRSSLDRSILSNSSEDSIDACLKVNSSLILCSPQPMAKLSESNDESFARFERRLEADLNLESRKEIIRLKAALEKANIKIASLERCKFGQPGDVHPEQR